MCLRLVNVALPKLVHFSIRHREQSEDGFSMAATGSVFYKAASSGKTEMLRFGRSCSLLKDCGIDRGPSPGIYRNMKII
jgi:hypothetical protein